MKWIGISGSWRSTCPELERDLEREVTQLLDDGNGIVTGGALGVDYAATAISLEHYPDGSHTKVILPTSLEVYTAHYLKRAKEGVITLEQAQKLIHQLETLNNLGALTLGTYTEVHKDTYYERNTQVVNASDELLAFQVNGSEGTQDTIDKARALGLAEATPLC